MFFNKKEKIREFIPCCEDLAKAINFPPKSNFYFNDKNILYLTVGLVDTKEATGYFDAAVIYCPFCGKKIQDKGKIAET